MIALSRARFTLNAPYLGEADLESYALDLFHRFDATAAVILPLSDYALRLELDEGSLKGCGWVLAGAGGLYVGIAQFGSFVQGVREIDNIGRYVADKLIQESPKPLHLPPESVKWARRDSAKIGQLKRLFERVKAAELDPDQATAEAIRLLQEDGDTLPPQFVADVTAAVLGIHRNWKQLEMPLESLSPLPEDSELPEAPTHSRVQHDRAALPSRRRFHVEVYRPSKDAEESITIIPLE